MNLKERDQKHNWHPYTQHKTAQTPIAIALGEGALLWDEDGKEYIDAIASWWVNPYGHAKRGDTCRPKRVHSLVAFPWLAVHGGQQISEWCPIGWHVLSDGQYR